MHADDDILKLVTQKAAEVVRRANRGLIVQPGALGDCILTLPLVKYMKQFLGLDSVDVLGHTEYIGILPGRTCVDGVKSIDSVDLHRLFVEAATFDLPDDDPLINVFADYTWIVTFLGEPGSDFEQNLIFTTNCSHSAEITTLLTMPEPNSCEHVADYYIRQLANETGADVPAEIYSPEQVRIKATEADTETTHELLNNIGCAFAEQLIVIAPGSGGVEKCWHLDNFLAIAEELKRRDRQFLFLLGPAELERFDKAEMEQIAAAGPCLSDLNLIRVVGLLSCAECFVGNDSGITHLAAAMGVNTVAVFGPTEPKLYGPIGPNAITLSNPSPNFAQQASVELQRKVLEILTS